MFRKTLLAACMLAALPAFAANNGNGDGNGNGNGLGQLWTPGPADVYFPVPHCKKITHALVQRLVSTDITTLPNVLQVAFGQCINGTSFTPGSLCEWYIDFECRNVNQEQGAMQLSPFGSQGK